MEDALSIRREVPAHLPQLVRRYDAITARRCALFAAGGIHLERFERSGRVVGRMVGNAPEFRSRADEYNALADQHLIVGRKLGVYARG